MAGAYIIEVTPPAGYAPSSAADDLNPDSNRTDRDTNGVPVNGSTLVRSPIFLLRPGIEPTGETDTDPSGTLDANGDMAIDFAFFKILSLGNRIWFDDGAGNGAPNNGEIDGAEQGVPDLLLNLFDANLNPVLDLDG